MDPIDPAAIQALMNRRAQLLAQEDAVNQRGMQPAPPAVPVQPPPAAMQQPAFSGYGQPGAVIGGMARPAPTPQQLQQLAALLQRRSQ